MGFSGGAETRYKKYPCKAPCKRKSYETNYETICEKIVSRYQTLVSSLPRMAVFRRRRPKTQFMTRPHRQLQPSDNLADEQGSVLAPNVKPVNIIIVSKNKKVITKELFSSPQILHNAPNSAQDSGNNYLCQGHQTVGPNTTIYVSNSSSAFNNK